jgi:hypothetical protein
VSHSFKPGGARVLVGERGAAHDARALKRRAP